MKKTLFVFCLYSTQLLSQVTFERTYSIHQNPEIYFIQPPVKNFFNESIYLIKTDYYGNENTITKMEKVDPVMVLNSDPDPFSSSIKINIPGNQSCNFSLRDMTGGVVFSIEILGETKQLNLSFLNEGIYYAAVSFDGSLKSGIDVKQ